MGSTLIAARDRDQVAPRRATHGSTLMEVIIATGILALLMTLLMQTLTDMRQYATFAEVQDDLLVESQKILSEVASDLSQSGWYLPDNVEYDEDDRNRRYYPYITVQNPAIMIGAPAAFNVRGEQFKHHWRPANQVTLATPAGIPGGQPSDWDLFPLTKQQFLESHYARSQEIVFLRVNSRPWAPRPSVVPKTTLNFGPDSYANDPDDLGDDQHYQLGIRKMSDFKRVSANWDGRYYIEPAGAPGKLYDIVPGCLWMRASSGVGELSVPIRWETVTEKPVILPEDVPTATPARIDPANLREYTYAVIPNPRTGKGQLVRAYRTSAAQLGDQRRIAPDATAGAPAENGLVVVDKVISDYVDRVTFDTFRTDPTNTLSMNQVRMRVFMSRQPNDPDLPIQHHIAEAVLALRTTTDSETTTGLSTALGTTRFPLWE